MHKDQRHGREYQRCRNSSSEAETEMDRVLEKLDRIQKLWTELKQVKPNSAEYDALMKKIRALSSEYLALMHSIENPKVTK